MKKGAVVLFLILGVAALVPPAATAQLNRPDQASAGIATDPEEGCEEMTPSAHSTEAVQGPGANIDLETLVFLDGVKRRDGKQVMNTVVQAYSPLGITVVPRFEKIVVPPEAGTNKIDGDVLNNAAKQVYGGERPKGIDVVHTLTTKDMHTQGVDIGGLADCIGGVRYPTRAFSSTEFHGESADMYWASALTVAHELGHLLGARHEYFNCVEGKPAPSVCTLMSPTQVTIGGGIVPKVFSNSFGSLEGAVVRGYAEQYAAP